MNKWKIAFWICFIVAISVTVFSVYSIIDQGVTITYMKESYIDAENDLVELSKIINQTDLSKMQIKKILQNHILFESMDFNKDTIPLHSISLIFKDNKLFKVINQ